MLIVVLTAVQIQIAKKNNKTPPEERPQRGALRRKPANPQRSGLDVSCTVAQGAAWKKVHSITDIYCIPHCTKCQPSGVYKWFQELFLLYHSENQVLVTCCVAPTDRISMTNLRDKLGHLATLRTALDSAEHTREHLMNLITSERLLGQLSPVKGAQRVSQSTADASPEYDHPPKKTKPGSQSETKMNFTDWAASPQAKTSAGLARCYGMYKHGSCHIDNDPTRTCKFDHSL
jgi:hypothetical protein